MKTLQVEKDHKDFKEDLNEITSGNPKHKNERQLCTIKKVKNLMIMLWLKRKYYWFTH